MAEPLHILLCEDNYPDVLYLKKLLDQTRLAYSMHTCEDGEQAINYLVEAAEGVHRLPDMVMLDIKLPNYSGLEVLEKMRELPPLQSLPAVIITGSDDPADLSKASNLKAFYLKKPADFEKLCQLMSVVEHACFAVTTSLSKAQETIGHSWGTQAHSASEGKGTELRILLVEDNPQEIKYVQELLRKSPEKNEFALEPVQDLASAMTRLAHRHFDVIALDLDLPDSLGLEGYICLQRLAPDVPVVIVTGAGDQDLGKEAVSMGAQDYIVKDGENYGEVLLRSLKYAIHRKRAEVLTKDSLIREHSILQEALAKAPIFVMRIDRDLRLIDINAATESAFGQSRSTLIGQNLQDLLPDIDSADLHKLIGSGLPFQHASQSITRTGRKLHQETFWDLLAWPVYSHNGLVHEAIVMANDMTEKVKAGQQRDEFVQTLAHDIKNPILSEQRLLTALLDRYSDNIQPADVGVGLNELFKSNQSLVRMLTNLLEAYKFESNLYKPFVVPIKIKEIIAECIADLKTLLTLGRINVSTRIDPDVSVVDADRIAIKRLLLNILHNSIKFVPPDGEIKISATTDQVELFIAISDTGPGLTPEEQASLFQRYAPTEQGKRKLHSSGLGLYICRRIVEAHNGSISCSSELARGATFTVALPLTSSDNTDGPVKTIQK